MPHKGVQTLSLLLFLAIVLYFCDYNFRRDTAHLDFRAFYAAGQMVAEGAGSRLYDMEAQREYQRRTIPVLRHEIYPFPYLPASALLYVALTWLPLRAAYDVWCVLSIALLAVSLELLHQHVWPSARLAWTLPLSLLYVPIGATLVNGQTSIIMLTVFTAAFVLGLRKCDLAAGFVVALALVKFNFVVPFVIIAALSRKYRLLVGFFAGATLFGLLCAAVAGWQFPVSYWHFLKSYSLQSGTITAWPRGMPNLRGLLYLVLRHDPPRWLLAVVSLPVIWQAVRAGWKNESGFATALVAAVLLSYHANLHDLTLLILPAFVVAAAPQGRWSVSRITLMLLPPLLLVLLVTHIPALAAVPLLLLLFSIPESAIVAQPA